MRRWGQYFTAGIAWALLLGPLAAYALFGFSAGVSWLWLFGDDSWPSATQWVLPLIALLGGLLAAVGCVIAALLYGRRRALSAFSDQQSDWRSVTLLTVIPLLLIVLIGARLWWEGEKYSEEMALAQKHEAAFTAFIGNVYKISALRIDRGDDGEFRAVATISGVKEGDYELTWQVADTNFWAMLAKNGRVTHLQTGAHRVTFRFTLGELARSYKEKVLKAPGGVLDEEPFALTVSLLPVLDESQRQALPPDERRRFESGDTSLRSQKTVEFPVRFVIRSDGNIEK